MITLLLCASIPAAAATIQGKVLDSAGKPVSGAVVKLERKGDPTVLETVLRTTTSSAGAFTFSALSGGSYALSAEKAGLRSHSANVTASGNQQEVELVLAAEPAGSGASSIEAMEFADKPNFTVAGVTDWTAVGGHGSDSTLRTSEDLARETLTLKAQGSGAGAEKTNESESKLRAALATAPGSFAANQQLGEFYLQAGNYREAIPLLQAAYQIDSANRGNEYDLARAYQESGDFPQARDHIQKLLAHKNDADLHRFLGELDEKLGDPLAAVREEEQAARLDPSEQNFFTWGSELLLHRAVWQAAEVFRNGTEAYPKSARMLAALGTALFAGARYDEAAGSLCQASDLNPADPQPYIFMGKVEIAAPEPLGCVEPRLARFVREQPGNALANYLYAMAILKRQQQAPEQQDWQQVETLLSRAVAIDPKCGDAYLQLGILSVSQHNVEEAIAYYNKAIEADPRMGEAHYRLGVAYDRVGAAEKARQEFQLHDEIERIEAAAIEQQRREVKQFLVVLQGQPNHPPAQ